MSGSAIAPHFEKLSNHCNFPFTGRDHIPQELYSSGLIIRRTAWILLALKAGAMGPSTMSWQASPSTLSGMLADPSNLPFVGCRERYWHWNLRGRPEETVRALSSGDSKDRGDLRRIRLGPEYLSQAVPSSRSVNPMSKKLEESWLHMLK